MKTLFPFLKRKRDTLVFVMFLGLGIVAYGKGLSAPFYFDDHMRIAENFRIKHFDPALLWRDDPLRFIPNLTFAINFLLARFDLTVWHGVNLSIHVLNAWMVYRLTALIFSSPALRNQHLPKEQSWAAVLTSLIFLLHPVQTQSVLYLVQRSTLLYAFFYLGTLYFYARARITGRMELYAGSAVMALAGTLTKPSFMTIPFAVALYAICFFRMDRNKDLKKVATFFLLSLPLLIIPLLGLKSGTLVWDAREGFGSGDFLSHFWTSFRADMTFLRLLVFPVNLNFDYDYPLSHGPDVSVILSMAALTALIITACRSLQKAPWLTFCIFWVFITLGAHARFFPLSDIVFEHWLYLPCYGISLFTAFLFVRTFRRDRTLACAAVLLTVILLALTSQRSALWADPTAFLEDNAAKSPRKARVWNNLGIAYQQKGQEEQARQAFKKAMDLDPDYFIAQSNLANIYISRKNYKLASDILKRITQQEPENVKAYADLGFMHAQLKNNAQALFYLKKAQSLNSTYPNIHMWLGNLHQRIGDLETAKREMAFELWLSPENANVYYNLGNINFQMRNFYEAMINYREALRRKPDFVEALSNLGQIYFFFQDYYKAQQQFEKAVELDPSPQNYFHMANVLYAMGRQEESRQTIEKAIQLYRKQGRHDLADAIQKKVDALTQ